MIKSEYYVNIRNKGVIIKNDILITKTSCIKLKSVVPENINSLKNIKNNVKKDNNSLSIDFKKLKEEYINKSNKRVKAGSIFTNIKANRFNKRFDRFNMRFNCFFNKSLLKTNVCTIKDSTIVKNHVDAWTSKNDLIVKNYVDACTSTDDPLLKIMSIHILAQMISLLKIMFMHVLTQMILLLKIMSMHVLTQMVLLKIMLMHVLTQMMYVLM